MTFDSTDRLIRQATVGVREEFDEIAVPEFSPTRRRRPPGALILILVLGTIGGFWLFQASSTDQTQVGSNNVAPPAAPLVSDLDVRLQHTLPRPAAGTSLRDPAFGTSITRLSQSSADEYVVPVQTPWSAWNADATRLLLYRTTSEGEGGHWLYDTDSSEFIAELAIEPTDIEQVFWSRTDPQQLLYFSGIDLTAFNIATSTSQIVESFEMCQRIDPGSSGTGLSADGDRLGFWCEQTTGAVLVAYRFSSGEVLTKQTTGTEAPLVTPSGNGFVLSLASGGALVLDSDLEPTGVRLDIEDDVFSFAQTAAGKELLVGPSYGGELVGSLVVYDLDTGAGTVIVGPDSNYPYPPRGAHVSAEGSLVALAMLGRSETTQWDLFDGEVLLIDLDDPTHSVFRVAHNRTSENIEFWSNAFLSLSPAGNKIAFSSDWGLADQVDTYIVDTGR